MIRDDLVYIKDVIDSIVLIEQYTLGRSEEEFNNDLQLQDAIIRRIEIMGEAMNNISEDFQKRYSHIPWREVIAMRNILIHEYFGVDINRIWTSIKNDMPQLRLWLEQILDTR